MAGTKNNTFIQPDSFSGSSDQLLNDIGIAWIIDENGDVTFENPLTEFENFCSPRVYL